MDKTGIPQSTANPMNIPNTGFFCLALLLFSQIVHGQQQPHVELRLRSARVTNALLVNNVQVSGDENLEVVEPASPETKKLVQEVNALLDKLPSHRKEYLRIWLEKSHRDPDEKVRLACPAELISQLMLPLVRASLENAGFVIKSTTSIEDGNSIAAGRHGGMDTIQFDLVSCQPDACLSTLLPRGVNSRSPAADAAVIFRTPSASEMAAFKRMSIPIDFKSPSFVREFAHDAALIFGPPETAQDVQIAHLARTGSSPTMPATTMLNSVLNGQRLSNIRVIPIQGNVLQALPLGYAAISRSSWQHIRQENRDLTLSPLSIQGRKPSHANIESEDYSLTWTLSLVTTSKRPEILREFRDYIVSDEGQSIIKKLHYVNVMPQDVSEIHESSALEVRDAISDNSLPKRYRNTLAASPSGEARPVTRAMSRFVLRFDSDASVVDFRELNPGVWLKLVRLAELLSKPEHHGKKAVLIGHTDSSGEAETNLDLSMKRVNAVHQILTALGIPVEEPSNTRNGLGEKMLLLPDDEGTSDQMKKAKEQNRRVEIWVR